MAFTLNIQLLKYSTSAPVSSPTGRIHLLGRRKPYYTETASIPLMTVNRRKRIFLTVPVSRRDTLYENEIPAVAYAQSIMLPGALEVRKGERRILPNNREISNTARQYALIQQIARRTCQHIRSMYTLSGFRSAQSSFDKVFGVGWDNAA